MKEEIAAFKARNGNGNISNKDLLMYLAQKMDKLEDRPIKCMDMFMSKKTAFVLSGIHLTLLSALAYVVFFVVLKI